jgi:1-acyl-sn-glycerol-3-phosphate acyltransferase
MPPPWVILAIVILVSMSALAVLSHWLLRNPRGDVDAGLFWNAARLYARVVHHLEVRGREHIPQRAFPGPLILVVNHSAGVDPVLVQAVCPFEIRWVMAADMRHWLGEPMWRWGRVIFVERGQGGGEEGGGIAGAREAVRHVRAGGVLGIFPEGAIERPPRMLLPFQPGVGLIIRRTGAPVLPVVIEGTPQGQHAWSSLWRASRAKMTFHPQVDYAAMRPPLSADEIARDLRQRFAQWTGWPLNDTAALAAALPDGDSA